MTGFIPPSFNLPLAWLVDFTFPQLLKIYQNIDEVDIDPEQARMLRDLRKERLLFFSNHPTEVDFPIAYYIAQSMGARFQYIASREMFEQLWGMFGKFISNLGAFSVVPGDTNITAVKTVRDIFRERSGKLALYPEGEPCSGENDNLLPFRRGIIRLGFTALDSAQKTDPGGEVFVLPAFIKYVYRGTEAGIKGDLHNSLRRIELRYRIDPGNRNLLQRFLLVARTFLELTEKEYNLPTASRRDYDYRIQRVLHAVLDEIGALLNPPDFEQQLEALDKLRLLHEYLGRLITLRARGNQEAISQETLDRVRQEMRRALHFLAVKPEYLISRPTAERFYDWLTRFENTVQGYSAHRSRKAVVRFARPFPLSEYYSRSKARRHEDATRLEEKLRGEMYRLLERSVELTMPIARPYDVGDEQI